MSHFENGENSPLLDFTSIDEMDPSMMNGFRTIYDREVPFEVRTKSGEERTKQGTLESIKIKILVAGTDDNPTVVRLELSSESDLFFHYAHIIDEKEFLKIQELQKLVVDFVDYATVLIRMLNSCIKEPHIHLAILTIFLDSDEARLDFIQNMEYKFVELMYCTCHKSQDEIVQNHITYRYNAMKQKLSLVQNRLTELTNLVKIKNPSLLLQVQKNNMNSTMMIGGYSGNTTGFANTIGGGGSGGMGNTATASSMLGSSNPTGVLGSSYGRYNR